MIVTIFKKIRQESIDTGNGFVWVYSCHANKTIINVHNCPSSLVRGAEIEVEHVGMETDPRTITQNFNENKTTPTKFVFKSVIF